MSKWKINPNFFALIMVASLFAEWKYMILLAFLVFVLWNDNAKLRKLTIQVVAISSACSLFLLFWNVVESGFSVVDSVADSINVIITLFDEMYTRPEWVSTLLNIFDKFEALLYNLIMFAVYLAKFSFILAIVKVSEPQKGIFKKIYEFLNIFTNFVDKKLYDLTNEMPNHSANPVQPTTPVAPVQPTIQDPVQFTTPVEPVQPTVQNNNMTNY